ncbi:Glucokinase [Rubellimicrobium mesophilum DSM 19309]|uniref:Glucokinase n=1 Tax=Rubellimicrobium mesophilum DSM 19309 TaxID=442562 RepID=A0A017HSA1_9RHOB|nr:glucokinase [Rubellimicrobium mesophilum]EYD76614.1 Glucokinase [Rubellimicrobium mesophilum DSM 19309]
MPPSAETLTLVADIGGTNTRVALAHGTEVMADTIRRYANAEQPSLEAALRRFLSESGDVQVVGACVDVAGPVKDGRGTLTNRDWTIDTTTLAQATGAKVTAILNDLQAQGHALGFLDLSKTSTILPFAEAGRDATKLVVNVGTGFNVAQVFETGTGRLVPPAEAGHVTLPVRSEADLRLARFVGAAYGFGSVEEVLSGRGIVQVHDWLGQEESDPTRMTSAEIMAAMSQGGDSRAVRAGRIFVRMLGAVAGDLALTTLPFGGVWLVGGLARAFAPYLLDFGFVEAFRDKGRFSGFMEAFGVGVVEDDNAALVGCASHIARLVQAAQPSA